MVYLRPAVSLDSVFVESSASLEQLLFSPATARHDTDHGPVAGGQDLLTAGRQLHAGAVSVGVVRYNLKQKHGARQLSPGFVLTINIRLLPSGPGVTTSRSSG